MWCSLTHHVQFPYAFLIHALGFGAESAVLSMFRLHLYQSVLCDYVSTCYRLYVTLSFNGLAPWTIIKINEMKGRHVTCSG